MILPEKNRPLGFEVLKGLLELPALLLLNTPRHCEAAGSLNQFSQTPCPGAPPHLLCCRRRLHHPLILPLQASCSSTRCSPGPTCSPHSAWCSQPGLALSSHRTFALSQPPFSLPSLLVNIDLHIRLNIDMGARSPFPIRAANPKTATQSLVTGADS